MVPNSMELHAVTLQGGAEMCKGNYTADLKSFSGLWSFLWYSILYVQGLRYWSGYYTNHNTKVWVV